MRKLFALAGLFLLISAAAWFSACTNDSAANAEKAKADSLAAVVERGRYLANHVTACIHCHSQRDFTKYSGPVIPGTEGGGGTKYSSELLAAIPGVIYSPNITPDKETGLGDWTDTEILRAITQGINKKGDTLFPLMPYVNYNKMAKEDLLSIIAYLRTLKPIKNSVPARQLMVPIALAYPAPALLPTVDNNQRPAETDPVAYGGYIANAADCATCHTPFEKGQVDFSRMFAGGNLFNVGTFRVISANITSDTTGIGRWNEEQFLNKFTVYRDSSLVQTNPGLKNTVMPMTEYAGMTDNDLKALFAYMKTVKPVHHKLDKYPPADVKEWNMGQLKVMK